MGFQLIDLLEQEKETINIMLVDNNRLFREGICAMLADHPLFKVIGAVGDRQDALNMASKTNPNMILLEPILEEEPCMNLIPELLNQALQAKILLVTSINDFELQQLALKRGAMGIVKKRSSSKSILLKAIEKVSQGEAWVDRVTIAHMLNEIRDGKPKMPVDPMTQRINDLTPRERQIISLTCQGMKAKDLAYHLSISESTARHYLSSIYTKLDLDGLGDLIIFAFTHRLVKLPG